GGRRGAPVGGGESEAGDGSAGGRRARGGLGHLGAPHVLARERGAATAPPGRDERWGVWGAISGPPMSWREIEARHGSAGARRALGGLGGHVGAPPVIRPGTCGRPASRWCRRSR